ncbi:uncharacterized protein [Venturia canescens]|uniref:uncharacterized protein isoform X1 n=1 Tax=Venturia canescens TaxID=32260 RepID=UPI001C9BFC96|nr:uncharacterized protein LOC122417011 isoform X1 [Venturia canescens]
MNLVFWRVRKMSSSVNGTGFERNLMDDSDSESDSCEQPFLASLLEVDTKGAHLDAVRLNMLSSLAALSTETLRDQKFLDSLPLASKLLIECLQETETNLSDSTNPSSLEDLETKIKLWQKSLEPWHEYLKKLKNLGTVPCECLEKLLNSLPSFIQAVFLHCKRSHDLYGRHFGALRSQLTDLYRQTGLVLTDFFSLIDVYVNFDNREETEKNVLKTVLKKIGDIAAVCDGVNLKMLMNTWKIFAKLATIYESQVKKSSSTDVVTSRYVNIAKDIHTLLHVTLRERQDTNYERAIKFAGLLLKILGRLCTLYRGYCGNEVCYILVQLLAKLYRYTPPYPSQHFVISEPSSVSRYSETHIVPAAAELVNILLGEKEFPKAFFLFGKSEVEDRICYHLLTLSIIEELIKDMGVNSRGPWLQRDENIVNLTLSNVDRCCPEFLMGRIRVPVRTVSIFGDIEDLGLYETSLKLLCHFVSGVSCDYFSVVEMSLLEHLVNGELWSCLLSCDVWSFLAANSSAEWCYECVSCFLKVLKLLRSRDKSQEFGVISNLIGRLYKLLPEQMKDSIFREIEDYGDRRLLEPFRKSLTPSNQQHLRQRSSFDGRDDLEQIFDDFCRSPSATKWTRLSSRLASIGAVPNDGITTVAVLPGIWSFLASRIPRSEGTVREMLFELVSLLLDCSAPDSTDNSRDDLHAASIYRSMLEIVNHLPSQHRLKINVFLRENLESRINNSGKESLGAVTDLFCRLIDDDDPCVRQEFFETYTELIVNVASPKLFDALSIGINRLPRVCRQMQLYLSNEKIHDFSKHSSVENYLEKLSVSTSNDSSKWHKCYQPDFSHPVEKRARLDSKTLEERVDNICKEIEYITERKNELSDSTLEKLRPVFLKFFQTD